MNLYEKLKAYNVNNNYGYKLGTAFFCGGFGQFLANPIDLMKVKMISERDKKLTMKKLSKDIYKKDGIKGFYNGLIPCVLRASFLAVGSIGSYDIVKQKIINYRKKEDNLTYVLSSFFGGFNSTLLTIPFDNLKSRLMNDSKNEYNGVIDCAKKSIKVNGIRFALPLLVYCFLATFLSLTKYPVIIKGTAHKNP